MDGKELFQFLTKLCITVCVIVFCSQLGRRMPSLAGLVATMPITTVIVLLWVWSDNAGNWRLMTDYTTGVLWGIIPTVCFFVVCLVCFRQHIGIGTTLGAAAMVWLIAAVIHQYLLGR